MKTTIERSAFLKALNHVQSVVERRNTIPILSNVLLEAENGVVTLTATDLEIEVRERVEAEIAQPGAITAPAQFELENGQRRGDHRASPSAPLHAGGRANMPHGGR